MKDNQCYRLAWLLPEDASAVAALEAQVHTAEHRAGEDLIRVQLDSTEVGGRNLSFGVYYRDPKAPQRETLVVFFLAFVMRTRRELGKFFDAPVPAELDPEQPTMYVSDWVVAPGHRRAAVLPAAKLAALIRADEHLRHLSIDAFSTPDYSNKWAAKQKWFARLGLVLRASYLYHDAKLDAPMYWVHLERRAESLQPPLEGAQQQGTTLTCRVVTDLWEWAELKLVWNRLLEESPEHTPWQSYAFLTQWWRHLSCGMPLRIFVVERAGKPCLILPMQIGRWTGLPGAPVRTLEPIGTIMEVNRPRLGLGKFDEAAYRCAFDAIWGRSAEWHAIRIDEKPWHDPEIALLRDYGVERGGVFRQIFSHLVPYLDLRQSWTKFLGSKSQKFRKNLDVARRRLEKRGAVALRSYESQEDVLKAFDVVLDLHERSWKSKRGVEHSSSEGYPKFFSSWIDDMAGRGQCRVFVLYCQEQPVAATVAVTGDTTYHSVQIVHDSEFAACSPGTLLESMEIALLMKQGRYRTYDMLGSFLSNKMRWTDTATKTTCVVLLRRTLRTFLMDAYFFLVKPYLRPLVMAAYRRFRRSKS